MPAVPSPAQREVLAQLDSLLQRGETFEVRPPSVDIASRLDITPEELTEHLSVLYGLARITLFEVFGTPMAQGIPTSLPLDTSNVVIGDTWSFEVDLRALELSLDDSISPMSMAETLEVYMMQPARAKKLEEIEGMVEKREGALAQLD